MAIDHRGSPELSHAERGVALPSEAKKLPQWHRHVLPEEGDGTCIYDTCDIGPFITIDVYDNGDYEVEGLFSGSSASMDQAKRDATAKLLGYFREWSKTARNLCYEVGKK